MVDMPPPGKLQYIIVQMMAALDILRKEYFATDIFAKGDFIGLLR